MKSLLRTQKALDFRIWRNPSAEIFPFSPLGVFVHRRFRHVRKSESRTGFQEADAS